MLLLTDGLRFVHNGQLWSIDNSGNLQPVKTDAAMMEETPGGIDFDSAQMNLEETGQKIDFDFSNIDIDPAQMQNLRGLKPVIINIIPVTPAMLNRLLGKSETDEPSEDQQVQNHQWFIKAEGLLV